MSDSNELSVVLVSLLKGVIDRGDHEARWASLLRWESHVRDHVAVLGLDLVIAEEDGYAFLRQRDAGESDDDGIPRLIHRRPLSYPVSLVLALLRRRVAEHDAASGEARVVASVDEVEGLVQPYLPTGSDEAKQRDRVESYLRQIAKLGFIRFLRGDESRFEIRRLINSFVTAEWLAQFERRMAEARGTGDESGATPDDSAAPPHESGAAPAKSGAVPHESGAAPAKSGGDDDGVDEPEIDAEPEIDDPAEAWDREDNG